MEGRGRPAMSGVIRTGGGIISRSAVNAYFLNQNEGQCIRRSKFEWE